MAEIKIKEVQLSAKGQITVPKKIRELLGVDNGDTLAFYVDENDKSVKLTSQENIKVFAKDKKKQSTIKKDGR